MTLSFSIFILSLIFILYGLNLYKKVESIRNDKYNSIIALNKKIQSLKEEQKSALQNLKDFNQRQQQTYKKIIQLQTVSKDIQTEINSKKDKTASELDQYYNNLKEIFSSGFNTYEQSLDKQYIKAEKEYENKISNINNQISVYNQKLDQIKHSVQAATAARLKQQEEQDKWRFYALYLTNEQIQDVAELMVVKKKIHDPSIVSKVIWSAYVLKASGDLCNRVLGVNKKCGIYKITNINTGQIYIGQSVNVGA